MRNPLGVAFSNWKLLDIDGKKVAANLHISQLKTVLRALHSASFCVLTFRSRSLSFNDVKWAILPMCGPSEHLGTNFQCFRQTLNSSTLIKFEDVKVSFCKHNDLEEWRDGCKLSYDVLAVDDVILAKLPSDSTHRQPSEYRISL